MSGKGSLKRSQQLAMRCAKLKEEGLSVKEITELVSLDKEKVAKRIELGKRLLSLGE